MNQLPICAAANIATPRTGVITQFVDTADNKITAKLPDGSLVKETNSNINIGTIPAAGVAVSELGDGNQHRTILTITALNLGLIVAPAPPTDLGIGALIYTFPAGVVCVSTTYFTIGITNTDTLIDADTPEVGVGMVVAVGAIATLGAGAATMENLVVGVAAGDVTGTATLGLEKGDTATAVGGMLIAAADAHTVYLNVADGWAGAETTGVIATGTVVIIWEFLA